MAPDYGDFYHSYYKILLKKKKKLLKTFISMLLTLSILKSKFSYSLILNDVLLSENKKKVVKGACLLSHGWLYSSGCIEW